MIVLQHGWNIEGIVEIPTAGISFSQNTIDFKVWFSKPTDFDYQTTAGAFTPDLWKHDCGEFFLKFTPEEYFEFNISPAGAVWWQKFRGIRIPDPSFTPSSVTCSVELHSKNLLTAKLSFKETILPVTPEGNLCVVQSIAGSRRFFSKLKFPGDKPDFHQPSLFAPFRR